ncbi:MAG TPA: NRDE family protein, partial [Desulfitobacteriaceae bacterium]|nr:NRDE family protein [Desulfitobacteriaceae bacterium]
MCLYIFAYNTHPIYRLIMASNRDEFYDRPTEKAYFWPSAPSVLAGRDLEMGGTWMGITKTGRFAALTNYRDSSPQVINANSRGTLVSNYLISDKTPQEYMADVINSRAGYNGFNLLAADLSKILYY